MSDDGSKQILPKSILTLSKNHTIAEYKKQCQHFNIQPLSDSTIPLHPKLDRFTMDRYMCHVTELLNYFKFSTQSWMNFLNTCAYFAMVVVIM